MPSRCTAETWLAVSSLQPAYGAIPSHEAGRFQINPAPLGNPNGSFDAPAIRCGAEVGKQRGVVTITGTERARWGCLIYADVRWLNLSTGATGAARMSNGLNGFPPEAELRTGSGQVVITMLQGIQGNVTPGFATASVP